MSESSSQGNEDFRVPEHVIRELGEAAGNASSAGELIEDSAEPGATSSPEMAQETEVWARENIETALLKWRNNVKFNGSDHWAFEATPVPASFDELASGHPNFNIVFSRLCELKESFISFGESPEGKTPSGQNVGGSMNFVLAPWGFFRNDLNEPPRPQDDPQVNMPSLHYTMVELQGDFLGVETEIMECLARGAVRYNDSETANGYLDRRISEDGNWGLLLMQTGEDAGLAVSDGKSPTCVDFDTSQRLRINGIMANKFGVFELLAYTLQEPRSIQHDETWLPINTFLGEESNPNSSHLSRTKQFANIMRYGGAALERQVRLTVDGYS